MPQPQPRSQPPARPSAAPRASAFLPTTREELRARGWDAVDVLLVTGDAYVDHPSFGAAVIGRVLEARGLRVGIVAQPDCSSPADVARLGRPRLFAGVTAGAMDSMVNHYTAAKRPRSDDAYTPGGTAGRRPDRALTVYARLVREAFGPDLPIVGGGVEASLRRIAHYDYWDDRVLPSVAASAPVDLVVYGQGELPILEIARRLAQGEDACGLVDVPGTALALADDRLPLAGLDARERGVLALPAFEEVVRDRRTFARFSRLYHLEHNGENARVMTQRHGHGRGARTVIVNEPARSLTTEELDRVHELPFTRDPHPSYGGAVIPAMEQIKWSIQILRGCAAGCSFCCITEHQGREVTSRSEASVLREMETLAARGDFRGTISDLGGATANMWGMRCTSEEAKKVCRRLSCVYPVVCKHWGHDHGPLVQLYRRSRQVKGVKHVFVGSGVRYDLAQADEKNGEAYLAELVGHHVSGQLKVAPEHAAPATLAAMKKPGIESFERFREDYRRLTRAAGKEQYLVPYFISSHPGCTLEDGVQLMEYLERNGWKPQQVQDFTPTPMTLASDMHWSGFHPMSGEPIHVTRDPREKRMQKALLRFADPASRGLVEEALRRTGRLAPGQRWEPRGVPWKRTNGRRPPPGTRPDARTAGPGAARGKPPARAR